MFQRTFLAINLPDTIKNQLKIIANNISAQFDVDPVNWTKPENLHVTIHFFGNKTQTEIENIANAINNLNINNINLKFDKICYGPDKTKPRMVWATLKQNEIAQEIKKIFSDEKLLLHITIGRINVFKLQEIEYLPDISQNLDFSFDCDKIYLMQSKLTKPNATYSIIKEIVF